MAPKSQSGNLQCLSRQRPHASNANLKSGPLCAPSFVTAALFSSLLLFRVGLLRLAALVPSETGSVGNTGGPSSRTMLFVGLALKLPGLGSDFAVGF